MLAMTVTVAYKNYSCSALLALLTSSTLLLGAVGEEGDVKGVRTTRLTTDSSKHIVYIDTGSLIHSFSCPWFNSCFKLRALFYVEFRYELWFLIEILFLILLMVREERYNAAQTIQT